MHFIIFIIIALAILFGAHYFLYFSIVRFFSVTNVFHRNVLLVLVAFLTVSFILSSVVIHWREDFFTRAFYFVSGFWLGLLVHLLIATAVVWLIFWITKLTGFNVKVTVLSASFFLLALLFSFYGVWNAFNPVIKNISVNIPHLPPQWMNKRIVQISDVHLGLVYGKNFLRDVVKKVNSVHPDMVVITGDLFDGMGDDLNSLVNSLNEIQAERGIFFVTGNHETYLGVERSFAVLEKTKVKILRDEVKDVNGLKLIGINYPERGEYKDVVALLQSMKKDFQGQPSIFLYHAPVHIGQFKESGVDLQLSGHTHKGQIFPFGAITKFVFKGYDYGLYQMDHYTLYTTNGVGTWGPAMRTGNRPEIVVVTLL